MPHSTHVHKSMLLRGVKLAPPTLNREDIEATKGRASHSGRFHGGAPLGGGRGRGRGNHINYANDRPNPFAAHINPGYAPPPNAFGRGGPPLPGGQFNGYSHTPQAYNGKGPAPPNSYYSGPPSQTQGVGRYEGRPPAGGFYSAPPQRSSNGYGNGNPGYQKPSNYLGPPQGNQYGGYNTNGR